MLWNEYTSGARNPTRRDVLIGRLWTFYFNVPFLVKDSLIPALGTNVAALHPFVDWGCVGIADLGARVRNCYVSKMLDHGMCELAVEVIEPIAYGT